MLGCFVIALLATLGEARLALPPEWRIGIFFGFLGAFTTFSTFAYDTYGLLRHGSLALAALNVLGSMLLGAAGFLAGVVVARLIGG